MLDIIKQWPILILLPMCTANAGPSIVSLADILLSNTLIRNLLLLVNIYQLLWKQCLALKIGSV